MAFIQTIEFSTTQKDAVLELMGRWTADSREKGTAKRATMAEDRSNPGHLVLAVWFESAEAAAENSARPETGAYAEQFAALCSDGPAFREFNVVEVYGD
jgi:quinol monooxygenase YgiN